MLLCSIEHKPNFDLSSLSFAIGISVCNTGNLNVPVRTPKWLPPVNFSGALVATGQEFAGDGRKGVASSGPFYGLF